MAAEQLVVELTESAAMADPETTRQRLQRLRELGVQVAIDDFGMADTNPGAPGTPAPTDANPLGDLAGLQNLDGVAYTGDANGRCNYCVAGCVWAAGGRR